MCEVNLEGHNLHLDPLRGDNRDNLWSCESTQACSQCGMRDQERWNWKKNPAKIEKKKNNIWWNASIVHSNSNQVVGGWCKCFFMLSYRGCAHCYTNKMIQSYSSGLCSSDLCFPEVSTSTILPWSGQVSLSTVCDNTDLNHIKEDKLLKWPNNW